MRCRVWIVVCLTCAVCGWHQAGSGAEEDGPRPSVLRTISALSNPVSYTETKISLGGLVSKIAADTGVSLVAARAVADEPVAVVVRELPASQVLEEVADLLGYSWRRTSHEGAGRYEIYQDLASKVREEALRQAALAEVEQRLRQELTALVEAASLPEERFLELRRTAEQAGPKIEQMPKQRRQLLRATLPLYSPVQRAIVRFLGGLSPQHWAALRERGTLAFFTEAQTGELSLPIETARILNAFRPSMDSRMRRIINENDAAGKDWLAKELQRDDTLWTTAARYRVVLRLQTGSRPYRTGGSLSLNIRALPVHGKVPPGDAYFVGDAGCGLTISAGSGTTNEDVEPTPEQLTLMEKDPVLSKKRVFSPKAKSRPSPGWPEGATLWRWPELLPELALTYGVHFIADSYWNAPSIPVGRFSTREPTALFSLIRRLSSSHYHWDRRQRLIRLRSRTWFLDRPREIPLRLVLRWKDLYVRHGALPLDEYAGNVVSLSDDQLESLGGLGHEGVFPAEMHDLHKAERRRHVLRLYALLTPGQRQMLSQGRRLALADMTPRQHELFVAQWGELAAGRTVLPGSSNLGSAYLSLLRIPYLIVKETRGGVATYRREIPPDAAQALGIHSEGRNDAASVPVKPPVRGRESRVPKPNPMIEPRLIRYPVNMLLFHLDLGPGLRETIHLTVASPG